MLESDSTTKKIIKNILYLMFLLTILGTKIDTF